MNIFILLCVSIVAIAAISSSGWPVLVQRILSLIIGAMTSAAISAYRKRQVR
jgi:hypothetical protein